MTGMTGPESGAPADPFGADADDLPALAAQRLVTAPDTLSEQDLAELMGASRRFLAGTCSWLCRDDIDDVTMEAITRVLQAGRQGRVVTSGNPIGYLLVVARNAAVSRQRRSRREVPYLEEGLPAELVRSDDDVARMLDRDTDADAIRQALATTVAAGDATAVRVVAYLLDRVQAGGSMPSQRAAAADLGLSHTGVAKALRRFREHLTRARRGGPRG